MGCDIHPYICYRNGEGKLKQFMYSELDLGRDYTFFGLLAGVRGKHKLFEAKGFPEDVPSHVLFDFNRRADDTHDASWLTTAELKQVAEAYERIATEGEWKVRKNRWLAALIGCMQGLDEWLAEYDPVARPFSYSILTANLQEARKVNRHGIENCI